MDKITTTLSQLQKHFEKAAIDQNENDTKERARKSEIKFTSSGVIVYLKGKNYSGKDCTTKRTLNSMNFTCRKGLHRRSFEQNYPDTVPKGRIARKLCNGSSEKRNYASGFKTQHEEIDNNVLQKIEIESTDPDVFTALKQLSVEDYKTEEEKIWQCGTKREKV